MRKIHRNTNRCLIFLSKEEKKFPYGVTGLDLIPEGNYLYRTAY